MWQFSNGGDGKYYGCSSLHVDLDYCYFDYIGEGRSLFPYTSLNPHDYVVPARTLSYKQGQSVMTGVDVAWLQVVLKLLGYGVEVDGSFGPATRTAAIRYQKDNSLDPDGYVGPGTRASLVAKVAEMPVCSHAFEESEPIEATCTDRGYSVFTCPLCGFSFAASYVAPLGHDFVESEVTAEPTYTEAGAAVYVCTRCGETEERELPVLPPLKGDANGDCGVDLKDVLLLRRVVAGIEDGSDFVYDCANAYADDMIDLKDVLRTRRIAAGVED